MTITCYGEGTYGLILKYVFDTNNKYVEEDGNYVIVIYRDSFSKSIVRYYKNLDELKECLINRRRYMISSLQREIKRIENYGKDLQ